MRESRTSGSLEGRALKGVRLLDLAKNGGGKKSAMFKAWLHANIDVY